MKDGSNLMQAILLCLALLQAVDGAAQPVTNMAAGGYHNLFLMRNGSLAAVGYNGSGEFGDGTYNSTNLPELIVISNVTAIAAGQYHSLFIKTNGSLWVMGDNANGQLGDGTFSTNDPYFGTNQPEQIVASNVTAIAAGGYHSLFLKRDGSLWAMGYNGDGELGDGTFSAASVLCNQPARTDFGHQRPGRCRGNYHSLIIKTNGSLWAMGYNGIWRIGRRHFQ